MSVEPDRSVKAGMTFNRRTPLRQPALTPEQLAFAKRAGLKLQLSEDLIPRSVLFARSLKEEALANAKTRAL